MLVFVFLRSLLYAQHCGFKESGSNIDLPGVSLIDFKIPIVFHVVYNEKNENISDSLIVNQVEYLNSIYSNNHIDATRFSDEIENPNIKFTTTTKILDSNALPMVFRTTTNVTTFNIGESTFSQDGVKYNHKGGSSSKNTDSFLNIWVCNLSSTNPNFPSLLGYAFPPTLANDWDYTSFVCPERQGVVINYRCFLDSQYFNILAHEIGHYLGLKHIWGNSSYSCDNDDGIDDTPLSAKPSYTCDFTKNTCDEGKDDLPDMVENVMDYSPASCGKYFTYGQVQRMISNLVYLRPNLYTAEPGEDNLTIMEAFPNPSFGKFTVFLHTTRAIPKSTLEIMDLTGKIVYSEEFNGKKQLIEIPPEHFRHGLYILRLHNEKYCITKKIQFADR